MSSAINFTFLFPAQTPAPIQPAPSQPVHQAKPAQQVAHPVQHKPAQDSSAPEDKPSWRTRAKSFLLEYKRVLHVTKKPDKFEFREIVKVSGLGILVIGLIGYIITLAKEMIMKAV